MKDTAAPRRVYRQSVERLQSSGTHVQTISAIGWIVSDFLVGLAIVWLYAAIRPRFGAGAGTAVIAAVVIWGISHVAYACLWFLGIYPLSLICMTTAGALVASLAAGLAGGRIYQEA
jgi:hypothetical protein